MKIDRDRKRFLRKELKEYEKATPMTDEEREALYEWVRSGRSVHDNGSYVCYEGGKPLDFLAVYREEREEFRRISAMGREDRKKYLREEYGIGRDAPSYEELKDRMRILYKKCMLYWEFLVSNGLREEAEEYVQDHMDEEFLPFDILD